MVSGEGGARRVGGEIGFGIARSIVLEKKRFWPEKLARKVFRWPEGGGARLRRRR